MLFIPPNYSSCFVWFTIIWVKFKWPVLIAKTIVLAVIPMNRIIYNQYLLLKSGLLSAVSAMLHLANNCVQIF